MSDTTSNDKTIRVGSSGRKPLSLKRDTDTVRQSFSGGRTKADTGRDVTIRYVYHWTHLREATDGS